MDISLYGLRDVTPDFYCFEKILYNIHKRVTFPHVSSYDLHNNSGDWILFHKFHSWIQSFQNVLEGDSGDQIIQKMFLDILDTLSSQFGASNPLFVQSLVHVCNLFSNLESLLQARPLWVLNLLPDLDFAWKQALTTTSTKSREVTIIYLNVLYFGSTEPEEPIVPECVTRLCSPNKV